MLCVAVVRVGYGEENRTGLGMNRLRNGGGTVMNINRARGALDSRCFKIEGLGSMETS